MLQSVLMTALTPLCKTDEITSWENQPFMTIWPEAQPAQTETKTVKGPEVKKTIRKKPKRFRTAYTTEQIRCLERTFSKRKYIEVEARKELADQLNITEKSIKIWFQNRRMKEKRDSESSCDSSVSESFVSSEPFPANTEAKIIPQNSEVKQEQADLSSSTYSCPVFNNINDLEVTQYQLPTYQYNDYMQYQNHVNMAPNTFAYDTNVYPTQYYPPTEYYHQHGEYYTAHYGEGNWSHDVFEAGYYC